MSGGSIQHWRSHRLTEVSEESGDARSRKEVRLTPFFNKPRLIATVNFLARPRQPTVD